MDNHDLLNSDLSEEERISIRHNYIKQLTEQLSSKLEAEEQLNLYQLIFLSTMIGDLTSYNKNYYFKETEKLGRIFLSFLKKITCSSDLDKRAKETLISTAEEMKKTHFISASQKEVLQALQLEYYHLL